ncbi:GNAT family N-acetyltransferase [Paenibacillus sp. 32352]|uniref:GNAT family N-acetyltransferase n=1 Tax=Paenibacillus sp. 32352 TaxID=1969111 RepID=UPI0009AC2E22|nr:GNAT family N-acetyltransferase [Paenibacillus sp. 32352]
MNVYHYDRASRFLEKVEPVLEKHEAVNNLLLGLLHMEAKGEAEGRVALDSYKMVVEDGDERIRLIVLINSKNAILYGTEPFSLEAVKAAVADLRARGAQVPGVIGPNEIARSFAEEWAESNRLVPVLKMNQRIYQLDRVLPVSGSKGRLRLATALDQELIAAWIKQFADSIHERITAEEASNKTVGFIRQAAVYLWDDDGAVSMAKTTRPTKHGIVLSNVYTPPEHRNKGYASSCVAALSQRMLDEGYSFCSLYTDLANPTSNHIYSQIGYHPVRDSVMYRFAGEPGGKQE